MDMHEITQDMVDDPDCPLCQLPDEAVKDMDDPSHPELHHPDEPEDLVDSGPGRMTDEEAEEWMELLVDTEPMD